jgi:hypothetical protein
MRFTALSLLLLLAAGCERGTPAAGFADPTAADRAEVVSYARSLEFDTSAAATGVTHVGGVEVRWSPERRAGAISDANLARGRIIGMAQTTGGTSAFGTLEGRSYIWVDSTAAGWRAVLIPDGPAGNLTPVSLYHGTRRFTSTEPTAFKVLADSFPNGRCGTRCCIMLAATWTPTPELLQRITDATHAP